MSDDDTTSDISDGDIELSEEDLKALGMADEEPEPEPNGEDEPPPQEEEPAPTKLKKRSKPVVEDEPEPEPEEEPRPTPRREKSKTRTTTPREDNPPPQTKPALARRKPKINTGEAPITWDEVAEDEDDLANEEYDQPILIGADPFEQEYNDNDYYERLEDPLGSKPATKLLLDALRKDQGKGKKGKGKGKKKKEKKSKLAVLDYSQQNFSPKAYLSTVHKKTSIDSLVSGRVQLEKKVTSRQKQLEFLVKDNFSRFVLCKDALDDVYVRVETERRAEGPANPIDSTEESYSDLITKSKDLFDKLLDRQVEIDKIRNVLSILKRSQFIFNLPRRMRESIERGEYAKVVLNYKKVKSIVASAVHASIKNIVLEVEKIVKDLHEQLFHSLDKPGASLREQEETIKLLIELGAPQDPAWHCIVKRYERIKEMLSSRRNASNATAAGSANSTSSAPRDGISSRSSSRSLLLTSTSINSGRNQAAAVLTYSQVLIEQLPELWQMSRSFFSGEYHKGVSEKRKKELTDQYTEEEFSKLMKELMQLYVDSVTKQFSGDFADMKSRMHSFDKIKFSLNTSPASPKSPGSPTSPLSPDSPSSKRRRPSRSASISRAKRSNSVSFADQQASQAAAAAATVSYMFALEEDEEDKDKEKVVAVLKCWKTISSLGVPPSYYNAISDLLDHLTHTFTTQTVDLVLEDLKTMHSLEDWQIEDLQYGITSLPLTFEATMRALLTELEGVPQPDDPLIVYIQKSFVECIEIFADNLHHLSMVALQGLVGTLPNISNMNVDYSPYYDDGRNIPGADARLLLTLNNCRFTRTQIIPDLLVRYQKEFNRPLYKFNMAAVYLFEDIERMCAQKYVANKVVVFKSLIKSGILFSGFDWRTQSPPLGIRDFIMTILMNLIFVHDELYRLSKSLVDSTIASLVEQIMLAFLGCFDFVDTISNYAAMQVGMEITFFWQVVSARYKNDLSSALYKDIDSILGYNAIMSSPDTNQKDKNNIKSILKARQAHSELLFECFSAPSSSAPPSPAVDNKKE